MAGQTNDRRPCEDAGQPQTKHGLAVKHAHQRWITDVSALRPRPCTVIAAGRSNARKLEWRTLGLLLDKGHESNLHPVVHCDGDCRVASLLTLNPIHSCRHFHRHGRACPGHRSWHSAATDGRDRPGHDTNSWFHPGRVGRKAGVELAMTGRELLDPCPSAVYTSRQRQERSTGLHTGRIAASWQPTVSARRWLRPINRCLPSPACRNTSVVCARLKT